MLTSMTFSALLVPSHMTSQTVQRTISGRSLKKAGHGCVVSSLSIDQALGHWSHVPAGCIQLNAIHVFSESRRPCRFGAMECICSTCVCHAASSSEDIHIR